MTLRRRPGSSLLAVTVPGSSGSETVRIAAGPFPSRLSTLPLFAASTLPADRSSRRVTPPSERADSDETVGDGADPASATYRRCGSPGDRHPRGSPSCWRGDRAPQPGTAATVTGVIKGGSSATSVLLVQANGTARKAASPARRQRSPSAARGSGNASLQLVKPDGSYYGPVVLTGTRDQGVRVRQGHGEPRLSARSRSRAASRCAAKMPTRRRFETLASYTAKSGRAASRSGPESSAACGRASADGPQRRRRRPRPRRRRQRLRHRRQRQPRSSTTSTAPARGGTAARRSLPAQPPPSRSRRAAADETLGPPPLTTPGTVLHVLQLLARHRAGPWTPLPAATINANITAIARPRRA